MSRLITLLAIMANICGGALLTFHLFGWMRVSADQVSRAICYSTAGAAAIVLIAGVSNDIFQTNRRPFGLAVFLSALWIAAAPTMELDTVKEQVKAFFPDLLESPTLILCLYLLILARLAAFGQKQPLGYALALLTTVIVCLEAELLGGPVYDSVFYFGVVSMMAAFTLMLGLGPGYQHLASWAICILLFFGGAYHVLT